MLEGIELEKKGKQRESERDEIEKNWSCESSANLKQRKRIFMRKPTSQKEKQKEKQNKKADEDRMWYTSQDLTPSQYNLCTKTKKRYISI
jgi:hypothetical protein